jgi:hydrogenase nickel incorporation protein HypA/HybF
MHEFSLVDALLRRVEGEARKHNATAVRVLKVSLGELGGVDPRFFRSAYEVLRAGTLCENAELELTVFPADWSCPSCGKAFAPGDVLRCEQCDEPARLAERSEALQLESIDMEVP